MLQTYRNLQTTTLLHSTHFDQARYAPWKTSTENSSIAFVTDSGLHLKTLRTQKNLAQRCPVVLSRHSQTRKAVCEEIYSIYWWHRYKLFLNDTLSIKKQLALFSLLTCSLVTSFVLGTPAYGHSAIWHFVSIDSITHVLHPELSTEKIGLNFTTFPKFASSRVVKWCVTQVSQNLWYWQNHWSIDSNFWGVVLRC